MKLSFQQEKERISITTFLVFWLLYMLFGEVDLTMTDYSKLYISQATQDNVDISKRVGLFYRAVVSALFLLPLVYFSILKLTNYLRIPQKLLQIPAITSLTGLVLIASDLIGVENERGIELFLFLTIIALIVNWLSVRYHALQFLKGGTILAGVLTLSIPLISGFILLFNSGSQIPKNINAWYIACSLVLLLIVSLLQRKGIRLRSIFNYLLPLAFIPLLLFLSIECLFYFRINHQADFHYKNWFVIFFVITCVVFVLYKRWQPKHLSFKQLCIRFYAPSALLSYILLAFYTPIMEHPQELFELANPAISQLRVFQFGEIPFVDFMSSHMFSEQFYGIFYNLLFGYNGTMDFYVYNFLYIGLFYLIAYSFLVRFMRSPFIALLILLAFPFVFLLFSTHLFYGILAFFATKRLLQKQTALRYFVLFITLTVLIIWRLDTGASTLLASFLFIPVVFFTERIKIQLKSLVKGVALFGAVLISGIGLFSLLRSPQQLWNNFKVAFHYITANQAHGYSDISYSFDHQFYIHHFLLPALGVVFICIIIYYLRTGKFKGETTRRYALFASLFLYLIFVMNFQRGLVRHGFMENNDYLLASTFFLATVLLLYAFIRWRDLFSRYSTFFGFAFALILVLKYFPISKGAAPLQVFLKEPPIATLNEQLAGTSLDGRMLVNQDFANTNYAELKKFLDTHLTDDQTFLNFSSTPMLYYYCQRRVPAYFCQNHQNTVDDFLQLDHLSRLNPKDVPVVLMPGISLTEPYPHMLHTNSSDGVLNAMRQYLLVEYIYANYVPLKSINGKMVWVSDSIVTEDMEEDVEMAYTHADTHHYAHIATALDHHFFRDGKTKLKLIKTSLPSDGDKNVDIYTIDESARGAHIFLRLHVENPLDDREVTFTVVDAAGRTLSNTSFICEEGQKTYTVLLSNRYLWYNRTPKRIRVSPWSGMLVEKVEFYKDERTDANNR